MQVFFGLVVLCGLVLVQAQLHQQQQHIPSPARPFCNDAERRVILQNCALAFRYHHRHYIGFLQQQPNCRTEVFSCQRADNLIRCLNTQTVFTVSDRCWAMVPDVITYLLRDVNRIPCTFEDIFWQCSNTTKLLPFENRPRLGLGIQEPVPTTFSGFGSGNGLAFPMMAGMIDPELAERFMPRRPSMLGTFFRQILGTLLEGVRNGLARARTQSAQASNDTAPVV